jgi:hypothetical protein
LRKLWALLKCQFNFSRFGFFSAANVVVTFVGDLLQPAARAVTALLWIAVAALIVSMAWSQRLLKPYAYTDVRNPLRNPRLACAGDVTLFFGTACVFLLVTALRQRAVVDQGHAASDGRG